MKVILLDRTAEEPVNIITRSHLIADSALISAGRPVFLPDFAGQWRARIYLTYRISRLGKSIKPRFAYRYYDAVTLALRLIPKGNQEYGEVEFYFDNCLSIAPYFQLELSDNTDIPPLVLENITFIHHPDDINAAIEQISKYSTLKNGDLILLEYQPLPIPITPQTDLHGFIGNDNPFAFKIR